MLSSNGRAHPFPSISIFVIIMAAAAGAPIAQGPVTLTGVVKTEHSGQPVVGATVELLELRRQARTDAEGRYSFEGLEAGVYNVSVTKVGYADQVKQVTVPDGDADFTLDLRFHEEPVLVTASAESRDAMQVYQPTNVVGGEGLEQRGTSSIGTTLQNEPGIATSSLSQASSRPVIRGLTGNRVLMLEDGTRTGDVSSLSDDHAVAVSPITAERIEVVRGPANLLYGGNAMGGVVNVISEDVPSSLHDRPTGTLMLSGSTNTEELTGAVDFQASSGLVSYSVGGFRTDGGEYDFDGGTAGNSQFDFDGFNGGVSFVGNAGYVGVSYKEHDADYGIPVSEDRELLDAGEKGVTIGMEEDTYKLRGEITREFGIFSGARVQAVQHDYTHTEFEDTGEPGTVFDQDTTEIRGDLTHKQERFNGTFGAWYLDNDHRAEGAEALLPFAETIAYAAFFYEEIGLGGVKLQFGGRYDDHEVNPGSFGDVRDFTGGSGAVGAIIHPEGTWNIAVNVTRNFKAPAAEELFANGPHVATFTFERGDPDLDEETSVGYDVAFRWEAPRFRGEVGVFRTDFQDFIFLESPGIDPNTGMPFEEDGLRVEEYVQADASFYGAEAHADIQILEHLTLDLTFDTVVAENDVTGEPLPRITPLRAGLGVHWDTDRFGLGAEARFTDEQDRVAPDEESTGDFTIYNVFGHIQLSSGPVVHRLSARVANAGDRLYRNHVSRVKDILPEPGVTAKLTYTLLY